MNPTETTSNINQTPVSANEVIKCGNCNQIAPGVKNRSLWAQVIVWLLFIIMWPVTVVYYIMNPKYKCSNCGSSFVGTKDNNGLWSGQKNGALLFILIGILVAIAIIGILSSIVLASLSSARKKGIEARENSSNAIASTTQIYIEATVEDIKKTTKFPLVVNENITWLDVSAKPKTIQFDYILKDTGMGKISNEMLKETFLPDICKSGLKEMLDVDITVRDQFVVKNSSTTFTFDVTKLDCK